MLGPITVYIWTLKDVGWVAKNFVFLLTLWPENLIPMYVFVIVASEMFGWYWPRAMLCSRRLTHAPLVPGLSLPLPWLPSDSGLSSGLSGHDSSSLSPHRHLPSGVRVKKKTGMRFGLPKKECSKGFHVCLFNTLSACLGSLFTCFSV